MSETRRKVLEEDDEAEIDRLLEEARGPWDRWTDDAPESKLPPPKAKAPSQDH